VLRSLSIPVLALVLAAIPAIAQTTDPNPAPAASKRQDSASSTDTKKGKKVLTNEDLSKSSGKISVVGNAKDNTADKPKALSPKPVSPRYVASVRSQIENLLKQIVDLDKQITDLRNFKAGEPTTNASGVEMDRRYEREPVEVRIRALERKKMGLQSKLDALYDQARKKGVASGELP